MSPPAFGVNFALILVSVLIHLGNGINYPHWSKVRQVRSLDGIWNFVKDNETTTEQAVQKKWYKNNLSNFTQTIPMPVPSSYNDITVDKSLRDHAGVVWYDRRFFIPATWENTRRVFIRFGSVNYQAVVWVNGREIVRHEIGHLPFEAEITKVLRYGYDNLVTVLCNNVLSPVSIPQGSLNDIELRNISTNYNEYFFDYFNYAGIDRSVLIYTTVLCYISDVKIKTRVEGTTGLAFVKIVWKGCEDSKQRAKITISDKTVNVAEYPLNSNDETPFQINNVKLWWPYLMDPEPGHLYELKITTEVDNDIGDQYIFRVGFRYITWTNTSLLINNRPVYLRGFSRHEDFEIKGRGFDRVVAIKDLNLLKWIGANVYRTANYPLSEEAMLYADQHGIMIIDECPATRIGFEPVNETLLLNHKAAMRELIARDQNHPSVIMWSLGSEPKESFKHMDPELYFREIVEVVKKLDDSRPITLPIDTTEDNDKIGKYLDIISFNRYYGWYYQHQGSRFVNSITQQVTQEARYWHDKYKKPVILSEYGAEALSGYHKLPALAWSEEYQKALLSEHFQAFDILRRENFFVGELIWTFADYETAQDTDRVAGNKKGLFTRNRHPKLATHLLRQRNFRLCKEFWKNCSIPADLLPYPVRK